MSLDKVIVVSGDSHATPPIEALPDYVESRYHEYLPGMVEDNHRWVELAGTFANFPPEVLEVIDTDGTWRSGGYLGVWDLDRRLHEMDREGIAAELVFYGDPRALMPFGTSFRRYDQELVAAGARAYARWAAETFAPALDRLLLVGDPGSGVDIDAMLAGLDWIREHGFVAATPPLMQARPDLPPLYDEYFDPYWSKCEELGIALICHAGYGAGQVEFMSKVEVIKQKMEEAGRSDLLAEMLATEGFFTLDLRPRQAMWQMMLGGVFDRHPKLRLVMAEVRADWMPETLSHLDAIWERSRATFPARRRPSEYWQLHGLTVASFVHKSEVEMRHEIGIESIAFGRDYPHAEGTWPNTTDWLSDAFAGVPCDELRLILGENAIRFFDLDRAALTKVADRIGPTCEELTKSSRVLDPRLLEHWDARGGYRKPREQVDHAAVDALLGSDPAFAGAGLGGSGG